MLEIGPDTNRSNVPQGTSDGTLLASICEVPAARLYHLQWHRLRLGHEFPSRRTAEIFYGGRAAVTRRIVIGCFVEGHMRGAVELEPLSSLWHPGAQIVLSVESAWQGRGIGTALVADAIRVARNLGIEHLHLTCHALNHRAQRIAEKFGASIAFDECECSAEIAIPRRKFAVQ